MEPQEADEAARLYVRSWQAGYKGLLPQYYLDLLSPERWKDSFEGLPGSFVLTEGGVIAGHSCARPAADEKMPGWGEVHTLYVLPEYWGRGFGTALLDNSVRWLKNQGFDRIYLWALEGNVRARRLYEKYGFTPTTDMLLCQVGNAEVTYDIFGIMREAHSRIPNLIKWGHYGKDDFDSPCGRHGNTLRHKDKAA